VKKKELESNMFNDLFHAAMPERKQRFEEDEEPELDEESQRLEDKKRARYEALKAKAKEY
jgi:hypothetical protein